MSAKINISDVDEIKWFFLEKFRSVIKHDQNFSLKSEGKSSCYLPWLWSRGVVSRETEWTWAR